MHKILYTMRIGFVALIAVAISLRGGEQVAGMAPKLTEQTVLQPIEFVSTGDDCSEATILDINFDEKNKKPVLAYTRSSPDGSRSILFYNPQDRSVFQKLHFRASQGKLPPLGGAFSDDGAYFTVGLAQSIKRPQDLYVFRKGDTGEYAHHKTIAHRPSQMTQLRLPSITPERFMYLADKNSVACYGAPDIPPNPWLFLGSFWSVVRLLSGFINPWSTANTLSTTHRIRPVVTIAEKGECISIDHCNYFKWYVSLGISPGPYELPPTNVTVSTNKRWIVCGGEEDSSPLHILDRFTGLEKQLHSYLRLRHKPQGVDNSGTTVLVRFDEENGSGYESRVDVTWGGKIHMHHTYCFATDVSYYNHRKDAHSFHAVSTELVPQNDGKKLTLQAKQEVVEILSDRLKARSAIPQLAALEAAAPVQNYEFQLIPHSHKWYLLPVIGVSLLLSHRLFLKQAV
jgi:hypothetical protein